MSPVTLPKGSLWVGFYTNGVLTNGKHCWMNTAICESEEEVIGQCLAMVNVQHIRVVEIPDMEIYGVPDSLQTLNNRTGEVVEYGAS